LTRTPDERLVNISGRIVEGLVNSSSTSLMVKEEPLFVGTSSIKTSLVDQKGTWGLVFSSCKQALSEKNPVKLF